MPMHTMWKLAWTIGGLGLGLVTVAAHAQTVSAAARRADGPTPAAGQLDRSALGVAALTTLTPPARTIHAPAGQDAGAVAIDARWRDSLDAFAAADRAQAPAPGGVLFVGSSSIRLWDGLESQFDGTPAIIKRGFGGSRLADCVSFLDRLVLPYRPRLVIVYAGDNDLAEGATAEQVLERFQALVEGVHAALPDTKVAFLSIKPSPLRAALMPQVSRANALVQAYAAGTPGLDYIDIHSRMLGPDGQPRAELFLEDRLHLNPAGYDLWRSVIAGHLR
jgi:lysophospholipase L1-like esterase